MSLRIIQPVKNVYLGESLSLGRHHVAGAPPIERGDSRNAP